MSPSSSEAEAPKPTLGDCPDVLYSVIPGGVGLVQQEFELAPLRALLGYASLVNDTIIEHNSDCTPVKRHSLRSMRKSQKLWHWW